MTQCNELKEYNPVEWEEVPCPVCGSSERKLYDRFGYKLKFTYCLCLTCRNIYSSPRPKYDKAFLKAAYSDYFMIKEDYEYEGPQQNEYVYNHFKEELGEIVRFDHKATHILDVGCAMGDFLYFAKKYYPIVSGVEISEKMAWFTRNKLNITVYQEQFPDLTKDKRYSCIHMSHVIEHIPNPNDWLKKARELLLPDGILVICVPNMFCFSRRFKLLLKRIGLRKGDWKNPSRTPDHLYEPTVSSMKYFLEKGGFEILSIYTYSRKNMTSKGFGGWLFNRIFKMGSNIRIYARIKPVFPGVATDESKNVPESLYEYAH